MIKSGITSIRLAVKPKYSRGHTLFYNRAIAIRDFENNWQRFSLPGGLKISTFGTPYE